MCDEQECWKKVQCRKKLAWYIIYINLKHFTNIENQAMKESNQKKVAAQEKSTKHWSRKEKASKMAKVKEDQKKA